MMLHEVKARLKVKKETEWFEQFSAGKRAGLVLFFEEIHQEADQDD
jgi:hypothetical protein